MAKLNPVFSGIRVEEGISEAASVKGVASKTLLLFGVAVLSAILSLTYLAPVVYGSVAGYLLVTLGAVVAGILGQVNPNAAKVCSFIYAACEGALLGLVSVAFDAQVNGIVLTAVLLTGTVFGVMLLLYSSNILRATARFTRVMGTLGISILVLSFVYLISFLINPNNLLVSALTNNPSVIILMGVLMLAYGAFMLILDFEQVNTIVANGFDKKYEWTAALGLMVTIIWIYIEILRLLYILYQLYDN